ncbi:MAG TPA: RNA polymerase sigma-70 factor [Chloroflexia bacterium]|nr:RNA polymerase sigma-70 factor [Chloroflexia bacterium]
MDSVETFNQHRGLLFSIAYRMLGSAADAEDVLQDAFLRWQNAPEAEVRSPRSYLTAVVTRLSIDELRSARARREVYVGEWLPEPVPTAGSPELSGTVELAETISTAFLLLLEKLNPVERAVFLLREVFDYEYPEIAQIVGKSEANCRQMVRRARQHLREGRPRFRVSREQQEAIAHKFLEVCAGGDMNGLLAMLAEDSVLVADGGGKARAAMNRIYGREKVARFVFGVIEKVLRENPGAAFTATVTELNGQPAIASYIDGVLNSTLEFEFDGEHITNLYTVVNPDKLEGVARAASGWKRLTVAQ